MLRLACALFFWSACGAAQSVEGAVTNSVTGAAIAGLKVEIQQGTAVVALVTGPDGRFTFDGLHEGSFTVRYLSPDFVRPRDDRYQASARAPVKIEARLNPLPRISGRVLDGRGKAVPKAGVELLSAEVTVLENADDSGNFDLRMPPGVYVLSASPPPGLTLPDPERGSGRPLGWARTFYPETVLSAGASQIRLVPGAVAANMDVRLAAVPAHAIRGVIRNPDGTPAQGVRIVLAQERPFPSPVSAESRSDGSFQFAAVVDGECRLSAQSGGLRATAWIDIAGRDLEDLTLFLRAPFQVTGKAIVDGASGAPAVRMPQIHLKPRASRFTLESGLGAPGIAARVGDAGNFTLDNVYAGWYSIESLNRPAPYYLDSIRLGDGEVTTPRIELSGPASILLVYKTNGGALRGTVENCANGRVWLVPQDPSKRIEGFFRDVPCDSSNRFEIGALRPGDYYAVAAGAAVPRLWLFGIFDDEVLKHAARITVRPGETTAADLRLQ